ncbi:MAG: hypothetical protein EZS28_021253 [Streblomastix strix]|uniref:Protein kinase domain-containing protein n=1 Tax=Streblomastix strix TaxID=222440 RepID=A0A5J4VKW6_9EUKA|nr:MAG: hypothetical protein EZS28_021253 [Streblomastix strix]
MDYEDIIRSNGLVPIRILGRGQYGCVYLVYGTEVKIIAVKIFQKEKFNPREFDAAFELNRKGLSNIFILRYISSNINWNIPLLKMEYANMQTLNIIAKQHQITLPSYTLRALMKQILEGIRVFHTSGLIHRDIKCDNILLHSPSGSGRVYVKISDFGFAKKDDQTGGQTYLKGTLPYMVY